MNKCPLCNIHKAKRLCPAINKGICSQCCGSQRLNTIDCPDDCKYLQTGKVYFAARKTRQLVRQSFNDDNVPQNDVFRDEELLNIIAPLELFFIQEFYGRYEVTDITIAGALTKICFILGEDPSNAFVKWDPIEQKIYRKFQEIIAGQGEVPIEKQKLCLLRILKSIDRVDGGIFGNRNYLEVIFSQYSNAGQWSHMFRE